MSEGQSQTTIVKSSNIGFALGILVVLALGMYLFKSGFIAEKFGKKSPQVTPVPSPSSLPVTIDDEPITLLDEDPTPIVVKEEVQATPKPVVTHKPVNTALGDNPLYLLSLLLGSAGVTLVIAKKLETRN